MVAIFRSQCYNNSEPCTLEIASLGQQVPGRVGRPKLTHIQCGLVVFNSENMERQRHMVKTSVTANGEVGYLIYCHATNRHLFRVYTNPPHDFVDYDILHNDLRVKIIDADAHFYRGHSNGQDFAELDHCPATLGIK